jgi:hypothetical protein
VCHRGEAGATSPIQHKVRFVSKICETSFLVLRNTNPHALAPASKVWVARLLPCLFHPNSIPIAALSERWLYSALASIPGGRGGATEEHKHKPMGPYK